MADANGLVAIVLAAGSASRFGSTKTLAVLDGRPLLQHVLDALAEARVREVIVVLGAGADEVEERIEWRGERRIRNPNPERGLASSLREGIGALPPDAAAALVALGDQPLLRSDVIRAVVDRWLTGSRAIVVPRYAGSGTLNPVLLARASWAMAAGLEGDRGMGPLIHASPELVTDVPVDGDNPDVDTPADLARLAGDRDDPNGRAEAGDAGDAGDAANVGALDEVGEGQE